MFSDDASDSLLYVSNFLRIPNWLFQLVVQRRLDLFHGVQSARVGQVLCRSLKPHHRRTTVFLSTREWQAGRHTLHLARAAPANLCCTGRLDEDQPVRSVRRR